MTAIPYLITAACLIAIGYLARSIWRAVADHQSPHRYSPPLHIPRDPDVERAQRADAYLAVLIGAILIGIIAL